MNYGSDMNNKHTKAEDETKGNKHWKIHDVNVMLFTEQESWCRM